MARQQSIKPLLTAITLEHMVLALMITGLPVIGLIWFGWRAAVTVLILTLIGLGLVKLRVS